MEKSKCKCKGGLCCFGKSSAEKCKCITTGCNHPLILQSEPTKEQKCVCGENERYAEWLKEEEVLQNNGKPKTHNSTWVTHHSKECLEQSKSSVEDWEGEFEKLAWDWFVPNVDGIPNISKKQLVRQIDHRDMEKIKSFISNLLTTQEKKVRQECIRDLNEEYQAGKVKGRQSVLEEVEKYITKNRHKIERIDRYVLDNLLDILTKEEK